MNPTTRKRTDSPVEAALFVYGPRLFGKGDAATAPNRPTEADLDTMVAYVEGRLSAPQVRAFRKKLTAQPLLQREMGQFIHAIRDTDYGRKWLEAPGTGSAAQAPGVFARALAWLGRPAVIWPSLSAAAAVGLLFFAFNILPDLQRPSGGGDALALTLVKPDRDFDRGDLPSAWQGYMDILRAHGVPEPVRREAQAKFETVTQVQVRELLDHNRFDQATQVAEQALEVAPDQPLILAQAADARYLGFLSRQAPAGPPADPDNPFADHPLRVGALRPYDIAPVATRSLGGGGTPAPAPAQAPAASELDRVYQYYNRACEIDPANVRALVGLVELHLDRGDIAQADHILARARQIAPSDPRVQNALGRLFVLKGREDLAVEAYSTVLRQEPDNDLAAYNLRTLYNTGMPHLPPLENPDFLHRPGYGSTLVPDYRPGPGPYPHPTPPNESPRRPGGSVLNPNYQPGPGPYPHPTPPNESPRRPDMPAGPGGASGSSGGSSAGAGPTRPNGATALDALFDRK